MRLLDLVEQDHGVRPAPDRLGELPGLVVADVSGRRADQPAHRVPLLELAHVQPDHPAVRAEQGLGQRAGQLGLAHPGRAEEQEAAHRPVRVAQPGPGPADRLGHRRDRLVLADDPVVQVLFEAQQPVLLLLGELAHRDAGGPRDDLGDVGRGDLGHPGRPPGQLVELLPDLADLVPQLGGVLVLLAGDGLVLVPLQFLGPPLQVAHVPAGGRDPQPDPRAGLVDQVDRLVRQEAVGDVAVGQLGRGHQRLVGVAHLVVGLVAVAQAAQDRDRVVHGRLGHQDRLEPPGQRRVLLDVLAVLVQRGRADDVQLAAGQRGLEHVARVHPALAAAARADQGVQLVDEDDQVVPVLPDLVDDPLDPLLEVAAVAGAGHHAGQLQLHDPLARQRLGHVVVHDALREPLDDRGLAHPGLADQHRVVLAPARQHLDGLLDLVVAADDRVDPALAGHGGEVAAELVQRRRGGPVARAPRAGRPALAGQDPLQRLGGDPGRGQQPARAGLGVGGQGEQDVLRPDVGGADRAGDLVRVEQRALGPRGQLRWLGGLAGLGFLALDLADELVGIGAGRASSSRVGSRWAAAHSSCSVSRFAPPRSATWAAAAPSSSRAGALISRVMSTRCRLLRAARAVDAREEVIERAGPEILGPVETAGHRDISWFSDGMCPDSTDVPTRDQCRDPCRGGGPSGWLGPREAVGDMRAEGVTGFDARVVEPRVQGHPQPPHHGLGRLVHDGGHGPDLRQARSAERHPGGGRGSLGGVAVVPRGAGQPPAHLHAAPPGTPGGIGFRPVNPMNSPGPGSPVLASSGAAATSSAHSPKPCRWKRSSMRSTRASLAARPRGAGKYRITSGSAFIAANGSRSSSRQRLMIRRSVRMRSNRRVMGTPRASATRRSRVPPGARCPPPPAAASRGAGRRSRAR